MSRLNVWHVAVNITGLAFQVQQKVITHRFRAKNDHYLSEKFFCVSVIVGLKGYSRGCGRSAFFAPNSQFS